MIFVCQLSHSWAEVARAVLDFSTTERHRKNKTLTTFLV